MIGWTRTMALSIKPGTSCHHTPIVCFLAVLETRPANKASTNSIKPEWKLDAYVSTCTFCWNCTGNSSLPLYVYRLRCPRNLAVCLAPSKTMFESMVVNEIYIVLLEMYSSILSRNFIAFWRRQVYLLIPHTRGSVYLHSRSQSRVGPVITSKLPRDLLHIPNQCFRDSYRLFQCFHIFTYSVGHT